MQFISHPDFICGLAARSHGSDLAYPSGFGEQQTWRSVREVANHIDQRERIERLRRLRGLIADAHEVRESGHVYDLGERLNELEFGHNFQADCRDVPTLPMEIAYIHFGYSEHMLFGNGRWIDGVYLRDISNSRGDGMLFTFVANNLAGRPLRGTLSADVLCEASNCASAFVPAGADPRSVLHVNSNLRGDPILANTIKMIRGADVALYGLSMLSPLRPISKAWSP